MHYAVVRRRAKGRSGLPNRMNFRIKSKGQYNEIPCNTMQSDAIPCNTIEYITIRYNAMHYNEIPCNTSELIQYNAIPCNTVEYNAIQSNTIQYYAIPCNTMKYHAIPCNTIQYNTTLCYTMQYNEIPCNTMKYLGTFGSKSGPPGHSEHHRDPQQGHFGPNGPFWAPGGQQRPDRSFGAQTGPFCLFLVVFSSWVVPYGL